jgi:hypothetical protein
LLVEPAALARAEQDSLSDAESRARRRAREALRRDAADAEYVAAFAEQIRANFPRCPADEATQIAAHACQRSSGRVGRSASAKAFDPEMVHLAVQAHVRHARTDYDRLLMQTGDRQQARAAVYERVARVLHDWEQP